MGKQAKPNTGMKKRTGRWAREAPVVFLHETTDDAETDLHTLYSPVESLPAPCALTRIAAGWPQLGPPARLRMRK